MVKFTTLTGGIDYFQETAPSSATSEEVWLPITETGYFGSNSTGVTKDWVHNHTDQDISAGGIDTMNGKVFNADGDGSVIAADASDGSKLWEHNHHGDNARGVSTSNGRVYSGQYDGSVIAADASDGSKLWEHTHNGSDPIVSVSGFDDVVFSAAENQKVVLADATDGSLTINTREQ
jgi:outer membrane protein assembly factor BamB